MGYYYRTNLTCTDPDLIASGSTFNQKIIYYEIIGTKGSEIQYISRIGPLHDEVIKLSLQHPNEEFHITTWNNSEILFCKKYTGVIHNGEYKETQIEPRYVIVGPQIGQVDNSLVVQFREKLSKYLEKVKKGSKGSDNRIHYNIPDPNITFDGLKVIAKFIWETEDHRFIAENKHGYMIEIKYESKDKENLERLRLDNKILMEQINKKDDDNLPF